MNPPVTSTSETYELLVSLLAKCPQTIEILPCDASSIWTHTSSDNIESSSAPFLFIEDNLGIPQGVLFKVYLHAIAVFKSARGQVPMSSMTQQSHNNLDTSLARNLTTSSSILVLASPSHHTALNARKHLVLMHLIDPHTELCFMASLLSSQHCVKYGELWHHRQWLLSAVYDPQFTVSEGMDFDRRLHFVSQEALQQELDLVSRACELYPRNYFAWTHRLICMRSLLMDYLAGLDAISFLPIFRSEILVAKGWINRHVSDYSAIHYILALSHVAFQSGDSSLVEIIIQGDLPDHAIYLVQEYPTHEALWMYIRTALSILDWWQTRPIQEFIDRFVQPLVHSQHSKSCTKEELDEASRFARQFLVRRAGFKPT